YWLRQVYWILIGIGAGFLVLLVDMRTIGRWAYVFHGLAILALILVLKYGRGSQGSPVERWFIIGGMAIQPAEFAKYTLVLAIAFYFRDSRRIGDLGPFQVFWPLVFLAVPFVLIMEQPDLGSAMLLTLLFIPLVVLAGIRLRLLISLGVLGFIGVLVLVAAFNFGYYKVDKDALAELQRREVPDALLAQARAMQNQRYWTAHGLRTVVIDRLKISPDEPSLDALEEEAFRPFISAVLRPYQQRRLITFVNPNADPLGAGYHVIQSKVAIGSGQFLGKGFGESTQGSLNFLPARHTDFIFAIFAEEWGFVGVVVLLALYAGLILRGLSIVFQTRDRFSAFLTLGIVSIIGLQAIVNIGMAAGLLPVVGVPLPLVSYGGSSMLTTMTGVAMLLNIRMRRFLWG
ncbi:MAG TPA: rod shape-determining protein RodA, partial [bacterium]